MIGGLKRELESLIGTTTAIIVDVAMKRMQSAHEGKTIPADRHEITGQKSLKAWTFAAEDRTSDKLSNFHPVVTTDVTNHSGFLQAL
jgi:hypothetical protein